LEFEQEGEVRKLCCRSNKEILEKTKSFKEEKRKKLEDVKQCVEGGQEKRILRDGGLIDSEEEFQSAEKFLPIFL